MLNHECLEPHIGSATGFTRIDVSAIHLSRLQLEGQADPFGGRVAHITLQNGKLNIIDFAMMDELAVALQEIESNDSIAVIVLRGAGDNFSAGVDIPSHTPDQ